MHISRLGPYELGKVIGKGGMGSVYVAVDSQTGQRVAVKALNPQLAQAEGFRERFEAEIGSLKTLRHDGVVRLYGYGEQDGVLFYSMELIEGTSLEEELRLGRRFNWREVADIAIQLCRALKHAHDHGVVHRDIKPANVLIDADDRVKLADFGIARLFGSTQLTSAGGVLGTADYMSPEQADGRPVTDRCDQYSLGGVMYALLAGRAPFRARTLPEMIQLQRFAEPEPVRRYAPEAPEQMEYLIKQLLSKDPQNRFPNTLVLARHLEAMVRALSRPAVDSFVIEEPRRVSSDAIGLHGEELAVTRAEGELERPESGMSPAAVESSDRTLDSNSEESPSLLADAPTPPAPTIAPTAEPTTERTIFTTVAEEAERELAARRKAWRAVAVQAAGVGLLLAALIGIGVYMSQPKNADALYDDIRAAVESEEDASLLGVERHVDEFLRRFPDDDRAIQVQRYQQQLELDRLERKLQLRARQPNRLEESLLPIEQQHYVDAIKLAENDLSGAIRALKSICALYDPAVSAAINNPSDSERDSQHRERLARQEVCLQLARRQIERLSAELDALAEEQLPALRQRLSAADQLSASDPERARRAYWAIVDLYGKNEWAAEEVAAARRRLKELE